MISSRLIRNGMLVGVSLAAFAVGGGVAQALPLEDIDGDSPVGGLPIIGDGGPDACAITSSDPYRKRACNQDGGYGRDGDAGSERGRHASHSEGRRSAREYDERDDETDGGVSDVNGAPTPPGGPRAVTRPGSTPQPF